MAWLCVCVTWWVWLPMMVAGPRFKTVQNKIQKSSSERCCHNFISKVAQTNNLLSTPFSNTINFIPMKKSFVVISWTSRFEDCCDRTNVVAASFLRLKIFDDVDTRQIFFYPRFKLSPISKTVGLACINFCCLCLSLSLSLSRSLLSLQHDHVGVCHHLELNEDVNWCRCHWRWWIWNGFCWEMSNLGCVRSSCLKFASSSSGLVQLVRPTCKWAALLVTAFSFEYRIWQWFVQLVWRANEQLNPWTPMY